MPTICKICRGKGELRSSHPDAQPLQGWSSHVSYPDRLYPQSGEIIVDVHQSFCGKCHGTGMEIQ